MKATTLEQGRELVKAGLDAKTADMSYLSEKFPKTPNTVGYADMVKFMEKKRIDHFNETGVDVGEIPVAPCWTAEALLETIPQRIAHGRWDTGAPKWLNFTIEKREDGNGVWNTATKRSGQSLPLRSKNSWRTGTPSLSVVLIL